MDNNQIAFKGTLEVDGKWASNFSREELLEYLLEYLKGRLNYSLGFRGEVKKLSVSSQKLR